MTVVIRGGDPWAFSPDTGLRAGISLFTQTMRWLMQNMDTVA